MSALAEIPRFPLAHLPTPLEPLTRLGARYPNVRLWLKRDDCTGLATGGNKTRKLEYLIADAKAQGADTVITFGAIQSNHARQTAAACARAGLDCHLVLSRRVRWQHPSYETGGNVLLDELLGATLHMVEPDAATETARDLRRRLERDGRTLYMVPTGGSSAIGALGYANAAAELLAQCAERDIAPDLIVHASSSGGTQAGLMTGLIAAGSRTPVLGINVYTHDHEGQERTVKELTRGALERIGVAPPKALDVRIEHRFVGEDYGIPTRETERAMRMLAAEEGVLLDPVYSGKAMGGLLSLLEVGELTGDIVFIHTGGTASLGVYEAVFLGRAIRKM